VNGEDGTEPSQLGEDCAVGGSPLKLHDYLADLQLSPTSPSSSNVITVSHRRPVSSNDARCVMINSTNYGLFVPWTFHTLDFF